MADPVASPPPLPNPDPVDAALTTLRSDYAQLQQDVDALNAAQSANDQAAAALTAAQQQVAQSTTSLNQARQALEALLDHEYSVPGSGA